MIVSTLLGAFPRLNTMELTGVDSKSFARHLQPMCVAVDAAKPICELRREALTITPPALSSLKLHESCVSSMALQSIIRVFSPSLTALALKDVTSLDGDRHLIFDDYAALDRGTMLLKPEGSAPFHKAIRGPAGRIEVVVLRDTSASIQGAQAVQFGLTKIAEHVAPFGWQVLTED
ncbi:hypothetical protein LTR53_007382 [Teratosphaeriaceae sp. CCFEE 6253]|nr:hypothetical protein LTR53_007382 [Teratosphaeriaceae sp. CCFEE 6253]